MDYGQDGQACRQTFIYRITEGLPVIRPESMPKRGNQLLQARLLDSKSVMRLYWAGPILGIIPLSCQIFFLTLTLRYPRE